MFIVCACWGNVITSLGQNHQHSATPPPQSGAYCVLSCSHHTQKTHNAFCMYIAIYATSDNNNIKPHKCWEKGLKEICLLPPAKMKLREGNVFRSMCDSGHRGKGA